MSPDDDHTFLPAFASPLHVPYGGDYSPEQWPRATQQRDLDALLAAGITTVTLNVFTWSLLQPEEDRYDFTVLDDVLGPVLDRNLQIVMATGTGAHPAWMARRHDVTRVDFQGRRHNFGVRHNSCPSSPYFREASTALAARVAERYRDLPGLIAWHVGNEYGGYCYCENCTRSFRSWLRSRYGSLEELNRSWYTRFWGHTMHDWDDIVAPNALSEHWMGPDHTAFQSISLDYKRFMSDQLLAAYRDERRAVRSHDVAHPVTTNLMGLFKEIDYRRWAGELDLVSWDNYPRIGHGFERVSLAHGLMRGLRPDRSFWVMEQTPSQTAWRNDNPLHEPGRLRLQSWQSVANGADAVMYFQMKASRGASEKFHGAVLNHAGRADTRVFGDVAEIGHEISAVARMSGALPRARAAIVFDWDCWWSLEMTDGPTKRLSYPDEIAAWYRGLIDRGMTADVVGPEADLSGYDLVLAPVLFVADQDVADRLEQAARAGAQVLTGVMSGRVDRDDQVPELDVPGHLAALCGVRIDDTDSRPPEDICRVRFADGATAVADTVFDLVQPIDAETVASYTDRFYAETPAITRRGLGEGAVWYVGTRLDAGGRDHLWQRILPAETARPGLERTIREHSHHDREHLSPVADDSAGTPVFEFLLAHEGEHVVDDHAGGVDILTGTEHAAHEPLRLSAPDVVILERRTAGAGSETRPGTDSRSNGRA